MRNCIEYVSTHIQFTRNAVNKRSHTSETFEKNTQTLLSQMCWVEWIPLTQRFQLFGLFLAFCLIDLKRTPNLRNRKCCCFIKISSQLFRCNYVFSYAKNLSHKAVDCSRHRVLFTFFRFYAPIHEQMWCACSTHSAAANMPNHVIVVTLTSHTHTDDASYIPAAVSLRACVSLCIGRLLRRSFCFSVCSKYTQNTHMLGEIYGTARHSRIQRDAVRQFQTLHILCEQSMLIRSSQSEYCVHNLKSFLAIKRSDRKEL